MPRDLADAPADGHTIFGLDPVQVHARFWAARGVQVVRVGEPSEVVRGAELYLLLDPRSLPIFDLGGETMRTLNWVEPRVLTLRLSDPRDRGYREVVVTDADLAPEAGDIDGRALARRRRPGARRRRRRGRERPLPPLPPGLRRGRRAAVPLRADARPRGGPALAAGGRPAQRLAAAAAVRPAAAAGGAGAAGGGVRPRGRRRGGGDARGAGPRLAPAPRGDPPRLARRPRAAPRPLLRGRRRPHHRPRLGRRGPAFGGRADGGRPRRAVGRPRPPPRRRGGRRPRRARLVRPGRGRRRRGRRRASPRGPPLRRPAAGAVRRGAQAGLRPRASPCSR